MIYVFDSGPLIDLFRHYYRNRFPTLWEKFDGMVSAETVVSVREVLNEIQGGGDSLAEWSKNNKSFFSTPAGEELSFVGEIFRVRHFQGLIRKKELLQGKPVADPFVIAKAKVVTGTVVTMERWKEHAANIPNVCGHFGVPCLNLENFMEKEDWTFR